MTTYQKPVFGTLSMDSENCGCCFHFTNSGKGLYVQGLALPGLPGRGADLVGGSGEGPSVSSNGPPQAAAPTTIVNVGNGSVAVTPLCNTGLPLTQPITFGVPVGVNGIHANVGLGSQPTASIDPHGLGVDLVGIHIGLPL